MSFKQEYRLNKKNRLITKQEIENIVNNVFNEANNKLKAKIDYRFKIYDINHYIEAFVHESFVGEQDYISRHPPGPIEMKEIKKNPELFKLYRFVPKRSNERLEFRGDGRIDDIVIDYLFDKYPDQRENFLTKLKIRLVKTKTLALFAKKLELQKYLLISSFQESLENKGQGREMDTILENCFEAFVGAIVQDYKKQQIRNREDYQITYDFISSLIELHLDLEYLINNNDNFKGSLVRYFQSIKKKNPKFETIYFRGKSNSRNFELAVLIPESFFLELQEKNKNKILKYQSEKKDYIQNKKKEIQKEIQKMKCDSESNIISDLDCWKSGCDFCILKKSIQDIDSFLRTEKEIIIGVGYGKNQKEASQMASKDSLLNLDIDLNF